MIWNATRVIKKLSEWKRLLVRACLFSEVDGLFSPAVSWTIMCVCRNKLFSLKEIKNVWEINQIILIIAGTRATERARKFARWKIYESKHTQALDKRTGERKCVELLRFHTWMEPSGNVASIKNNEISLSSHDMEIFKFFSFFIAYSSISSETSLYFLSKSWYKVCCVVVYHVFFSYFKQGGVHWIKKKRRKKQ